MRRISLAILISIAQCLAQQTSLNFTGQIQGSLKGEDGTAIVGGYVSVMQLPPYPKRPRQTDWTAVTGDGGVFQFGGLNDGRYRLCAQAPKSVWLSPCEWERQPIMVTLSSTQPGPSVAIVMKKGVAVPIRVDDPGQLLVQHEGRTPGAHVLIGVANAAFAFTPAATISRDSSGRNLQVVVPFNSPVKLVVSGSSFQLSDEAGQALSRTAVTTRPLAVQPGQQVPQIRLRVTGVGQ